MPPKSTLKTQVWNQVRNQVWNQVWNQVRNQAGFHSGSVHATDLMELTSRAPGRALLDTMLERINDLHLAKPAV